MDAGACFAVLVPLVEREDGLHVLYEVRALTLRRQPGEVCFPGGRVEPGESVVDCALRETEEELAIPRREIELIGTPDFICNQGGFLLRPVSPAGYAAMRPAPAEVGETFTAPLTWLAATEPEVYRYELLPRIGEFPYAEVGVPENYRWAHDTVEVPVWHYGKHVIWGMTARIARDIAATPGLL